MVQTTAPCQGYGLDQFSFQRRTKRRGSARDPRVAAQDRAAADAAERTPANRVVACSAVATPQPTCSAWSSTPPVTTMPWSRCT